MWCTAVAEPARRPLPDAAPAPRRRPALFSDHLQAQPLAPPAAQPAPSALLRELVGLAVLAACIGFAVFLWCA